MFLGRICARGSMGVWGWGTFKCGYIWMVCRLVRAQVYLSVEVRDIVYLDGVYM